MYFNRCIIMYSWIYTDTIISVIYELFDTNISLSIFTNLDTHFRFYNFVSNQHFTEITNKIVIKQFPNKIYNFSHGHFLLNYNA